GALTRLADDLRGDRSVAVEAAAHRAGVLIVLPLGLCFLPAFVLAGLVPVVVAVLGDVL
ncbi:secretion system protein, partial [Actinoplanes sp. NPDC048791]